MNSETFDTLIHRFKANYPALDEHALAYIPRGTFEIAINMDDHTKIIYDDFDKTVRQMRDPDAEITEQDLRDAFATNLNRQMRFKGITQQDLSDLTGISRQSISRYQTGISTPSGFVAYKMAKALRCELSELLGY